MVARREVAGGGGSEPDGPGLFKIPIDGGAAVRLIARRRQESSVVAGRWPDRLRRVRTCPRSRPSLRCIADGSAAKFPEIKIRRDGERARFSRDGKSLIYMQGALRAQDFWLLDLATLKTRQLTHLRQRDTMRTFDVADDGSTSCSTGCATIPTSS